MADALQLTSYDQASEASIAECMTVMTRAFHPSFGEAWTAAQLRSMMSLPGANLIIARLCDRTVGFGMLRAIAEEAELLLLAVDPDHQGAGHGLRILDRCLMVAERNGAESVFLEVRDGNPAIHLYSKAGFIQYNRRKDYYVGTAGTRYDAMSFKVVLVRV